MGSSLAFHIIFASLGVGLPVLLLIVEGLSLRAGADPSWRMLARRWSKAFGSLFAIGAVSGTVLSFELGLLWPGFMRFAGGIIGLPFSMEGFAFFIEAIFVGLYLYGWERLSPMAHWLTTIPLAISGGASAWFVTTANAWMNSPAGFRLVAGRVTDVHPIQAIFNAGTPIETVHTMISSYLATGFAVAAVYAAGREGSIGGACSWGWRWAPCAPRCRSSAATSTPGGSPTTSRSSSRRWRGSSRLRHGLRCGLGGCQTRPPASPATP
jgi:cytochrome d ubiquinol oxidase subunit I